MISWPISLDPQTHSAQTLLATGVARNNPGAAASQTDTFSLETRISSNWSFSGTTTYFQVTNASFSLGGTSGPQSTLSDTYVLASFLATTDSTSTASGLDRFGNSFTSGSSVSVRSILNDTTTQTTRAYSYYPTQTSLVATTFYTSSSINESATTITSATSFQSISTVGPQATKESTFTTTTTATGGVVSTPILATVIEAEPGEIIWAVATSAATNLTNTVKVASSAGTSTTRTTVYPWTATESVTLFANTDETTAQTIAAATDTVTHKSIGQQSTTQAVIENYNVLPNVSTQSTVQTVAFGNTTASSTYFPESQVTFTKTIGTETRYFAALSTAPGYTLGSSYQTATTAHSTNTRQYTPLFAVTSTSSLSEEVAAFTTSQGLDTDSQTFEDSVYYTWTATTYETTTNAITTFARQPQGMTTEIQTVARSREFKSGVVNATGGVGLGYSAAFISGSANIGLNAISRGASIVFPSVYEVSDTDSSITASVTISGVSTTYKAQSDTTTVSGLLSLFGQAQLGVASVDSRSVMDAASLGLSETVYQSMPRGAYVSNGLSFTTSGQTSFSTRTAASSAWIEPLSFVVPLGGSNSASPIWWTVSKSSHSELSNLTASSAYTAT